mmetsp:Transcript_1328/g.2323  ORF Transcript_1328/g.2323 Transcript_1328/m.2323 type:complete len:344 (+) Transcript_1328:370-1401(+)
MVVWPPSEAWRAYTPPKRECRVGHGLRFLKAFSLANRAASAGSPRASFLTPFAGVVRPLLAGEESSCSSANGMSCERSANGLSPPRSTSSVLGAPLDPGWLCGLSTSARSWGDWPLNTSCIISRMSALSCMKGSRFASCAMSKMTSITLSVKKRCTRSSFRRVIWSPADALEWSESGMHNKLRKRVKISCTILVSVSSIRPSSSKRDKGSAIMLTMTVEVSPSKKADFMSCRTLCWSTTFEEVGSTGNVRNTTSLVAAITSSLSSWYVRIIGNRSVLTRFQLASNMNTSRVSGLSRRRNRMISCKLSEHWSCFTYTDRPCSSSSEDPNFPQSSMRYPSSILLL